MYCVGGLIIEHLWGCCIRSVGSPYTMDLIGSVHSPAKDDGPTLLVLRGARRATAWQLTAGKPSADTTTCPIRVLARQRVVGILRRGDPSPPGSVHVEVDIGALSARLARGRSSSALARLSGAWGSPWAAEALLVSCRRAVFAISEAPDVLDRRGMGQRGPASDPSGRVGRSGELSIPSPCSAGNSPDIGPLALSRDCGGQE